MLLFSISYINRENNINELLAIGVKKRKENTTEFVKQFYFGLRTKTEPHTGGMFQWKDGEAGHSVQWSLVRTCKSVCYMYYMRMWWCVCPYEVDAL